MNKSYIWSLPTRIFHWLFALLILLAFLTDDDELLQYHAVIGYAILLLIVFRLLWGFVGPKYSLFKDFSLKKEALIGFFKSILSSKQEHIGHNPAASYVMLAMILLSIFIVLSGALTFGVQEGKGIFSFLNTSLFKKMELFEELHETFANIFIALIVFHLLGVVSDKLLHPKYETLSSIFTGYKRLPEPVGIQLTFFQKMLAWFFFMLLIAFLIFNVVEPKNSLVASKYTPIDYDQHNELFVTECGSCHTLYPS